MSMEVVRYCIKWLHNIKSSEKLKVEDAFILGFTTGYNGSADFIKLLQLLVNFRIICDKVDLSINEVRDTLESFIKGECETINTKIHTLARSNELEDQLVNKVESPIRFKKLKPVVEEEKKLKENKSIEKNDFARTVANLVLLDDSSGTGESSDNMKTFNVPNDCVICEEKINRDAKVAISSCYHSWHRECMIAMARSQLESGNYELACPIEGCIGKIILRKLLAIIEPEEISKILENNFRVKGIYDPNKVIRCETEGCPYFDILGPDFNELYCPFCSNGHCSKCNSSQEFCLGHAKSQRMVNNSPDNKGKK